MQIGRQGEVDGQTPRAIILEIGTNQFSGTVNYQPDTPLDASRDICAVINALRQKFPQPIPICVMAIFPRRGLQSQIDAANALTKEFCATLPHVKFIDLKAVFTQADGTLKTELCRQDGTHLAPKGYEIWAQAIQKELDKK